jgi:hypothetical protein
MTAVMGAVNDHSSDGKNLRHTHNDKPRTASQKNPLKAATIAKPRNWYLSIAES